MKTVSVIPSLTPISGKTKIKRIGNPQPINMCEKCFISVALNCIEPSYSVS